MASSEHHAPLPMLETAAREKDTAQIWAEVDPDILLLALDYQPTEQDHGRCYNRILWVRPYFLAACLIFYFVSQSVIPVVDIAIAVLKRHGHVSLNMILGLALKPVVACGGFIVVIGVGQLIGGIRRINQVRAYRLPVYHVIVSTSGIKMEASFEKLDLAWTDIVAVVEYHGDVYLLGTRADCGFYIPRTAFTGREAGRRFRDACTRLWRTKGNANMVPPEILAEFAPKNKDQ